MVRWWWLVVVAGCAGILDEDETPPVAVQTRDSAVVEPPTTDDAGIGPRDMSPIDASLADRPPLDMAPPADMAPVVDAAPPPPDMPPPIDRGGCIDDIDCDGEQICEGGRCIDPPRCAGDGDCAPNERCEDGECLPGRRPECVEDADCENDGRCIDGTCARGECVEDTDCAVNERCEEQRCVPDLIQCAGPADCPMGEACVDGRCDPLPPPECVSDDDCGMGEVCAAGVCEADLVGGCATPGHIADFGEYMGDTTDAPAVHRAQCANGATAAEAVFSLGLPMAGPICLRTTAADFDTVLHVRQGDCVDPENEIACNDDLPNAGGLSELDLEVGGEAPLWVFVDGFGADAGPFTLRVTAGVCNPPPECVVDGDCDDFERCVDGMCVPECVMDADCADGQTCEANRCVDPPPAPGTCAAPLPVGLEAVDGVTLGDGVVQGSCGGGAAPEVVYRHVAAADGPLCFDTAGSGFDTVLYVRADDCDGMEIGCADDGPNVAGLQSDVSVDAVADQAYVIVVDGYTNRSGAFTLTGSSGACGAPPGECDGVLDAVLGQQMGSTVDAPSLHTGGCGRTDGAPEVVFRYRPAAAGPVCARTAGSDFDTVLYVRAACGDPDSQIACHDDVQVGVDSTSALTFDAAADTDYFIFVDGYVSAADGPQSGNFVLDLSAGACP